MGIPLHKEGGWGRFSGQAAESVHVHPMEVGVSQEFEGMSSVLLGIPTVPRPKGINYLEQTLQAILAQVDNEVSSVHACVIIT